MITVEIRKQLWCKGGWPGDISNRYSVSVARDGDGDQVVLMWEDDPDRARCLAEGLVALLGSYGVGAEMVPHREYCDTKGATNDQG